MIGCGWFGLPLANRLVDMGYLVNGSTTSTEKINILKQIGINPFLLKLTERAISGTLKEILKNCDTLVINIPPGFRKQPGKNYVAQMAQLIPYIETSNVKKVLYISSTSVFEDEPHFPVITGTTIPNGTSTNALQLIKSELLFQNSAHFTTTIIRFSGLIGKDRHPAFSLSGRTNILNPLAPVNLIHIDDCIKISVQIIEKGVWGEVFNASNPLHPNKIDYYTSACKRLNLAVPKFNSSPKSVGKIVNSEKVVQKLEYKQWTSI